MQEMNGKRLLLAIGVVAFVVIASVAIFSIDWNGGDDPIRDAIRPVNIADYGTTDVSVQMLIRGPVNNNQEHQNLKITVGRDQTVAELISGYQGTVVRAETTPNNADSYKTFLSALHNSRFNRLQLPPKGIQYDGACPRGQRFTFEFINGGEDAPKSSWATSCGKKTGTFAGDRSQVETLFIAQIPEAQYDALTLDTIF
jgi:hypothetical protein